MDTFRSRKEYTYGVIVLARFLQPGHRSLWFGLASRKLVRCGGFVERRDSPGGAGIRDTPKWPVRRVNKPNFKNKQLFLQLIIAPQICFQTRPKTPEPESTKP